MSYSFVKKNLLIATGYEKKFEERESYNSYLPQSCHSLNVVKLFTLLLL